MINFLHRHRNSNADSRRLSLDRCLVQSLRFTVPAFRNEVRARKTEPTTTTQDRARRRAFEQICLLTNGGLIGVGRLVANAWTQHPWSFRLNKIHNDVPIQSHETVEFRFENSFLVAVGTKALRAVLEIGCGP